MGTLRRCGMRGFIWMAAAFPAMAPALAQEHDLSPLLDRLDRMEREMNQLQRQVYRGGGGENASVPVASGDSAMVSAELRMDQLETNMRTLTGRIEEANFGLDQIKTRFDKFLGEVDSRLSALEHGGDHAAPPPSSGAQASSSPSSSAPVAAARQPGAVGVLGQIPAGGGAQTASKGPAPETAELKGATPQEQYNYAFGLLRQADYATAEQALRLFVRRYPNDPLAGNAQYWLGETYYVRKDYANAASAFAEGFKKYPQGGKAAENLLKLGIALGNLGQKKEACLTFGQFDSAYPKAATTFKERLAQQKKQFGCS